MGFFWLIFIGGGIYGFVRYVDPSLIGSRSVGPRQKGQTL